MEPVTVYMVAGAETPEGLFQPLMDALRSRFDAERTTVMIRTLRGYGGDNESIMKQLYAIRRDTRLQPGREELSIGGQRVRKQVKILGAKSPILFIGHGGGGVAAYHGAILLSETDGCDVRFVAQVGSPKVPIAETFKSRVGYLAKKGPGVEGDLHAWQGSWSHDLYKIGSHRYPGLLYNAQEKGRRFYAPHHVAAIDIRGQHPSYFSPVKGKGPVSNLAKTMSVLWEWFGGAAYADQSAGSLRP